MNMKIIGNVGSGKVGDLESWSLTETVTPAVASDTSATIGDATLVVGTESDTALSVANEITLGHPTLGNAKVIVNGVREVTPRTSSLSADSQLARFLTGTMDIPGIESGRVQSALDVALQATGSRRQTGPNALDNYWSLEGHSVGFDANGDILTPSAKDGSFVTGNVIAAGLSSEKVLFQTTTNFCQASLFSATTGLPRGVVGDTIPMSGERSYVKITIPPSTSGVTTTSFQVNFGPSFRRHENGTIAANVTTLSINLSSTPSTGTLAGSITTQDANGAAVTTSLGSSASVALARTQTVVLSLEVYVSGAAIYARAHAASAAGASSTLAANTPVMSALSAQLYSKQWRLTQAAGGPGVRDLVIRRSPSDAWDSFLGLNYALASPLVDETGGSLVAGSPIASFKGELWEYLKQVAVARKVEIVPTIAGITLRLPGTRSISLDDRLPGASVAVSRMSAARNVVLTCQNTAALTTLDREAFKAETIYSVAVGETKTFDVALPEGVRFVWSPRPWYNSKATNGITLSGAAQADEYTALENGTIGRYFISGQDSYPVSPAQWSAYGGLLTAAVVDGRLRITLRGPDRTIPGVTGPFRIGESSGSTDYAVLRIMGVGVTSNPVEISVPTGAAKSETRVDKAATVNNIAVGNLAEAYDALAWMAQRGAGPVVTLTASVPLNGTYPNLGLGPGSIVKHRNNVFRVDTATISDGVAVLTCSRLARLMDMPGADRTLAQYATDLGTLSSLDYSIRPLALTA